MFRYKVTPGILTDFHRVRKSFRFKTNREGKNTLTRGFSQAKCNNLLINAILVYQKYICSNLILGGCTQFFSVPQ
jgi:hypothetical protein